jgi:hypothetical protein
VLQLRKLLTLLDSNPPDHVIRRQLFNLVLQELRESPLRPASVTLRAHKLPI